MFPISKNTMSIVCIAIAMLACAAESRKGVRNRFPVIRPFLWLETVPDTFSRSFYPPSGRGILLMRSFMDEISFNEQGNQVTLVKRGVELESADDDATPSST